jgi:hypothetical protein
MPMQAIQGNAPDWKGCAVEALVRAVEQVSAAAVLLGGCNTTVTSYIHAWLVI